MERRRYQAYSQWRPGHRSCRRLPEFSRRSRPCAAHQLAADGAAAPRRHLGPGLPGGRGGRVRRSQGAAGHRPGVGAAAGPPGNERTGGPARHRGRRGHRSSVPGRRLRRRRDRRGPDPLPAAGRRGARHRDRARAPSRRAGARLRGLADVRDGGAGRTAPLAAPGGRAQRRRRAHPMAGRHHHPLLRRRAARRAVHRLRARGELDQAADRVLAADSQLPARPRPGAVRRAGERGAAGTF
jgi:hypothetical protein